MAEPTVGGENDAHCDVLLVGGGVCGLWTLHTLRAAGYNAWLIENASLGNGQTIASQGILHAGAKYKLPGNAVDAAQAVEEVQGLWEQAIRGADSGSQLPDLRSVRIVDTKTLLWTTPGLGSRIAAKGASRVMRSKVSRVSPDGRPVGFTDAPAGVEIYETTEMVLDPASLVERLAADSLTAGRILKGNVIRIEQGERARVWIEQLGKDGRSEPTTEGQGSVCICTDSVVLTAGEGNERLLDLAGIDGSSQMQRRPLHQLVAIGVPFDLNGHCLQLSLDKPALTVTTGELDGRRTWYFGGGPAEEGVGRTPLEQIEAGRSVVSKCLPWVDQTAFEWRTFEIDRAEGRMPGGKRPSEAVVKWCGERVMASWPTKLVLAPRAAQLTLERLVERGRTPTKADENTAGFLHLEQPQVAERVW